MSLRRVWFLQRVCSVAPRLHRGPAPEASRLQAGKMVGARPTIASSRRRPCRSHQGAEGPERSEGKALVRRRGVGPRAPRCRRRSLASFQGQLEDGRRLVPRLSSETLDRSQWSAIPQGSELEYPARPTRDSLGPPINQGEQTGSSACLRLRKEELFANSLLRLARS